MLINDYHTLLLILVVPLVVGAFYFGRLYEHLLIYKERNEPGEDLPPRGFREDLAELERIWKL